MAVGILVGLIWGAAIAVLNAWIGRKSAKKNKTGSMVGASILRAAIDLAALALIFVLRNVLPFRFDAALIGTAIAMSMVTILIAYRGKM